MFLALNLSEIQVRRWPEAAWSHVGAVDFPVPLKLNL